MSSSIPLLYATVSAYITTGNKVVKALGTKRLIFSPFVNCVLFNVVFFTTWFSHGKMKANNR